MKAINGLSNVLIETVRFLLCFAGEIFKMFDVRDSTVLAEPANRRRMIKKAAEAIIIEDKLLGKQKGAEWMAQ